ncbi:GspE/PulE family protein [Desulforegula conservatrix]|uniref:GspE/PulE family protein n=1 Tax=Desulforegula conservatrix TaxID=153026 RepID=UPI00040FE6B9|nr:GspE/PulE family protein [Desulforegula conservatrix]
MTQFGFADEKSIVEILAKIGLVSVDQARQIMRQKDQVRQRLEGEVAKKKKASSSPEIGYRDAVDIIDVIVAMNLDSEHDSSRLDEDAIYYALSTYWKLTYKKIDPLKLDLNIVTTTIPKNFALKHLILPIEVKNGELTVATPNPFNSEVLDDIKRASGMRIKPVVSSKTDVIRLIDEFFGFKRSIAAAETQFEGPVVDLGNLEQYVRLKTGDDLPANDHHIVNAVNHLFSYAIQQRASDIHIEPKRDLSLVRLRIDGVLHPVYKLPKKVHNAIISRIKALSRLDMAEKRRPQDGRIKIDRNDVEVEIRVSTVPVAFGEKVVMRIMDPDILFQDLDGLGFSERDFSLFKSFIERPNGIILVTGPTGSGKSTTLYSALRRLSTPEVNIMTVEDPIEMVHEDFNQIAVQSAINITFSSILRNILRQDPDIIMIGEMRDFETAENAVQASLTGHLVLSTLHTNDAPSSIVRLLDIGVPSFLIQATITGIIAQRLVRKICPFCRENYEINSSELSIMGIETGVEGLITLTRGKGCVKCRNTGYLGRIGIFEILPLTDTIKALITSDVNIELITNMAEKEGMRSLRKDAIAKMIGGITTYQEVLRVTINK